MKRMQMFNTIQIILLKGVYILRMCSLSELLLESCINKDYPKIDPDIFVVTSNRQGYNTLISPLLN